jgi:hypothetical protein
MDLGLHIAVHARKKSFLRHTHTDCMVSWGFVGRRRYRLVCPCQSPVTLGSVTGMSFAIRVDSLGAGGNEECGGRFPTAVAPYLNGFP